VPKSVTIGGGGVEKYRILRDVIYGRPLKYWIISYLKQVAQQILQVGAEVRRKANLKKRKRYSLVQKRAILSKGKIKKTEVLTLPIFLQGE
jgi:hypothetical protein